MLAVPPAPLANSLGTVLLQEPSAVLQREGAVSTGFGSVLSCCYVFALHLDQYLNCLIVSNICKQARNSSKQYLQAMPKTPVSGLAFYLLAHKAMLAQFSFFFFPPSLINKV